MENRVEFNDIPGQSTIKERLLSYGASGNIPHALLISGPPGTGKMLLARAFAKLIHCEHPSPMGPCGHCRSCRLHAEISHPDLHFIYPIVKSTKLKHFVSADFAPEWREMMSRYPAMPEEKWLDLMDAGNSQPAIYVDEAEHIVESDAYPPFASDRKIFIIWLPERMRPEAANKLLKVIEEPSPTTLFILVSNNELRLLPTIFSRLHRLHAGRLSDIEIQQYLRDHYGLNPHDAIRLAALCNGSIIRADEVGAHSGENEEFLLTYQEIMRAAYSKKVAMLKKISDSVAAWGREKLRRFLLYMARMIRENFIYNLKMPQLSAMTPEEEDFSTKFSPFINHANVEDFIRETDSARSDIERNANAKLVLFDFFIHCIILLHKKPKN